MTQINDTGGLLETVSGSKPKFIDRIQIIDYTLSHIFGEDLRR